MTSNVFFRDLYKSLSNQGNQGLYIIRIFQAGGSQYFKMPSSKAYTKTTALELERRYAKDRPLSVEIKASFSDKFNISGVTDFLEKSIDTSKLRNSMNLFGIPRSCEENKKCFAMATAIQFQNFVCTTEDDIENRIPEVYQRMLHGEDAEYIVQASAVQGDAVWVEGTERRHKVGCYELFEHRWVMHNRGSVPWYGRRLVFVNASDVSLKAETTVLDIPETEPGKTTSVSVRYDARGSEGKYRCEWEMQDDSGRNCFPNNKWDFNFDVEIEFNV